MKTQIATLLLMLMVLPLLAQDIVKQNRNISAIKGVRVNSGIDLYLSQGNAEKLEVSAPEDKIDKIITEVKDGILHIYFERSGWNWGINWSGKEGPKARLVFKDLQSIKAGGGSDVYATERLIFDKVVLAAGGGSDLKMDLTAEEVECNASGGSDAILTGSSKYFIADASGGSDIKAKDLRTKFCKVNSSGGSDAHVWVEQELVAHASGGSDVYYYGQPKQVKKSSSGGSDINRR